LGSTKSEKSIVSAPSFAPVVVTKTSWGKIKTASGYSADLYTLSNAFITVQVATYGAHVVSIEVPDRNGIRKDVVLGFEDLAAYESTINTHIGSTIGRYANRIANGIFSINGSESRIPINNGPNAIHGGPVGFDQKIWAASPISGGVKMSLLSPDGDMGFPGALTVHASFTLEDSSLRIVFNATTTRTTVLNLTSHSYFNLSGNGDDSILNHVLTLNADCYTPVDFTLIPTGEFAPVADTPFDFRTPTTIGARINSDHPQLQLGHGYDHNFVLNDASGQLQTAAHVLDPVSGRTLTISTTEPGVQFYTSNFLDGSFAGRGGVRYQKRSAFCLETQHFPDSPNHPDFPSTLLQPGNVFRSETVLAFGISNE